MFDAPEATSLTLGTNPGGLRWLADCARLGAPAASGKLTRQTRTVCFDTPDLRLYRRGIDLQIRQEGNRFIQRLATTADAGPLPAGVWEADAAGPDPAVTRLGAADNAPILELIPADELTAVLAWHVTHQTRILQEADPEGGTQVFEIAFDEGEIEAGGAPIPIAELGLTLLKGGPGALYRLALELQQSVPLNIEPRSRLERALPRIARTPPRWHKSKRPVCDPAAPIDTALADLFRACLRHCLSNEGAALDGRDPEGVHQMRVALRRLRSAWSVFGSLLPSETLAPLKADTKWLAGNLGPARDWDVFLTERLAAVETRHPGNAGLSRLRQCAEGARDAAYHQMQAAIMSQRTTRLMLALGMWIETHGWREDATEGADDGFDRPLGEFAAAILDRQYNRVRKRGRHFGRLPAEARHRLRIDVKKLRYTAEFFTALNDAAAARRFVAEASQLQDVLGEMNDVATLATRLDSLQAKAPEDTELARGIGIMIGDARAHLSEVSEAEVREAWRRFKRCAPFWGNPRK